MAKENATKKPSAYDIELAKAFKQVKEFKKLCEANIVSLLWKTPELFFSNEKLELDDFDENMWKVYFEIAKDIIIKENKVLDEITVNFYLEKHKKLEKKYSEYGGYDGISSTYAHLKEENMDGYVEELRKWQAVIKMLKKRFPVAHRISEFVDMSASEIYEEHEAILNDVFINVDEKVKTYSITDGLDELIDKLDQGIEVGLPLDNLPMLTKEIGGFRDGEILLVSGVSGVGKSTLLRNTLIPSCIKFEEKVLFMLNEENLKKFQSEMLVWVANNVYKEELQKYTVRDGNYSDEDKELLRKCAKWIKDKVNKRIITIVPLTNYTTAKAVKIVKKYCSLGITKFVLDTFKADSDIGNRKPHEVMPMKMVEIFDTVKEESKNVHISIILQLTKASTKKRYLTNDDIGMFKNVVDPVAVSIMARAMFEDEYEGGVNELKVYHMGESSGKSKIQTKIHKERHYQIIFITKNRNGASQDKQIVIEHDLGKNTIKEVGFCYCPVDW